MFQVTYPSSDPMIDGTNVPKCKRYTLRDYVLMCANIGLSTFFRLFIQSPCRSTIQVQGAVSDHLLKNLLLAHPRLHKEIKEITRVWTEKEWPGTCTLIHKIRIIMINTSGRWGVTEGVADKSNIGLKLTDVQLSWHWQWAQGHQSYRMFQGEHFHEFFCFQG